MPFDNSSSKTQVSTNCILYHIFSRGKKHTAKWSFLLLDYLESLISVLTHSMIHGLIEVAKEYKLVLFSSYMSSIS